VASEKEEAEKRALAIVDEVVACIRPRAPLPEREGAMYELKYALSLVIELAIENAVKGIRCDERAKADERVQNWRDQLAEVNQEVDKLKHRRTQPARRTHPGAMVPVTGSLSKQIRTLTQRLAGRGTEIAKLEQLVISLRDSLREANERANAKGMTGFGPSRHGIPVEVLPDTPKCAWCGRGHIRKDCDPYCSAKCRDQKEAYEKHLKKATDEVGPGSMFKSGRTAGVDNKRLSPGSH